MGEFEQMNADATDPTRIDGPNTGRPGSIDAEAGHTHGDERSSSDEHRPGVGPWPGDKATWPSDDRYDPELLEHGDRRNVVDEFRYWRMEAIVAELDRRRHPFHIAIENWEHDFNIGSIVRTANAFAAKEVHIIGRRRWNRRGAMVTDRYQHIRHHETAEAFLEWAAGENLPVLAIDNTPGAVPIEQFRIPERCVFVFGQEGPGLSPAVLDAAEATLEISQFGSTRSINAGAAAAIVMHDWIRAYRFGRD